jgi:type II secretory pathway component PulF
VIGRAEMAVLGAAQRVGNLPWALAEMADSSRRRLGYRLHGLTHLLFPAVVLSFGLLVLFVVVGFFMPLVLLIEKLGRW